MKRVFSAAQGLLSQRAALSIVDQGIVSGTSFLTSVIIGRLTSREELGVYYLALSLVLFVQGLREVIISAPYTIYCGRREGEELALYSGSSFAHLLVLAAFGVAGLLGLAGVLSFGLGPRNLLPVVWVLLAAGPLLLVREFIRSFTFSHLQLGTAIALDSTVAVVQICGLLLLAAVHLLTAASAFAAIAAGCAIASLGWFLIRGQEFRFSRSQLSQDWQHNWSFARWALAGHLISNLAASFVPWIVLFTHGEGETGLLAACWSIVGLTNVFVTGVNNYLTPKSARAYIEGGAPRLLRVLYRGAATLTAATGTVFVALLVAGGLLISAVYGAQYSGGGIIAAVLALGVLIRSLGNTAGAGLWAIERPQAEFAADLCCFAVTLTVAVLIVPPLGVIGAAIATVSGIAIGTAVRCFTLSKSLEKLTRGSFVRPQGIA